MAELICPYCWERTRTKALLAQCPERCGQVQGQQQEFFPGSNKACPHGQTPSTARYCPHCRRRLEYDYIRTRSRIIAIIGSRESGKSTYVGVLINELRNRVGADLNGMSTELVGDSSRERYREVFWKPMYGENRTVAATDSIRVRHRLEPLLFMMRFPKARRMPFAGELDAAMMIFYDTAGEEVLNADRIDRLVDYLDAADAILVMIDPLQVTSVRRAVDGSVPVPTVEHSQVQVLQQLAALLRAKRRLAPNKRIDTPLALAVCKTDALTSVLGEHSAVRRSGAHLGSYDEADGQYVHDEIRAVLSDWSEGQDLIHTVENAFSCHRFFGVSALGLVPPAVGQISPSGIRPLRVEDPLLWLLSRFGLVKVRKAKR